MAFQLPVSIMFGVATATSGLALVTEIDLGYFDKLLVAPIRRSSIIFGRLASDFVRGIGASIVVLLAGLAFGAHIEAGVLGAIVLVLLGGCFGVAYAGFGILVALKTRNVQATQSSFLLFFPLLFLSPNFVPFDRLPSAMNTLAHINPVSYVIVGIRSLVINGGSSASWRYASVSSSPWARSSQHSPCERSPPTTGRSVPRVDQYAPAWRGPLRRVPDGVHTGAAQARATFMPETAWPAGRLPPGSSRERFLSPVPMSSMAFDNHRWIACARLLGPHLTRSMARLFHDAHHHGAHHHGS